MQELLKSFVSKSLRLGLEGEGKTTARGCFLVPDFQ
jgi:hypothetical protein